MNNLNRLQKLLKSIDDNKTYFNVHAGDVLWSFFLILVIITSFTYLAVKKHNIVVRKEWQKNKCRPEYSLLAGWINAPPGASFDAKLKYTTQNFSACNIGILEKNMKNFTSPFINAQGIIRVLFDMANKVILKIKLLSTTSKGGLNLDEIKFLPITSSILYMC